MSKQYKVMIKNSESGEAFQMGVPMGEGQEFSLKLTAPEPSKDGELFSEPLPKVVIGRDENNSSIEIYMEEMTSLDNLPQKEPHLS